MKLSFLLGAVSASLYEKSQGICNAPRGNKLGGWRNTNRSWCQHQCESNASCQSYLFAEGARHQYTGTCEIYDMNNPTADGNGGWSCYDRLTSTYQTQQGMCKAPTGRKLAEWRKKTKSWCQTQCENNVDCKSYLYAEGARHMYTGTCALYDDANVGGDGNTGWTCNNKVETKKSYGYTVDQGICKASGVKLAEWRHKDKYWCMKQCNANSDCHSFLFAEGAQHMYTGTCALFDANSFKGDGNKGWKCYSKYEHSDFRSLKQSAIESMPADTEEDEDEDKNEEDLFIF